MHPARRAVNSSSLNDFLDPPHSIQMTYGPVRLALHSVGESIHCIDDTIDCMAECID